MDGYFNPPYPSHSNDLFFSSSRWWRFHSFAVYDVLMVLLEFARAGKTTGGEGSPPPGSIG